MAALTGPSLLAASPTGSGGPRWVLLGFQKVTAADTFDLSTLTNPAPFSTVTAAVFFASDNRTATPALCTIATPVVTVVGAGIANDAGFLLAVGE